MPFPVAVCCLEGGDLQWGAGAGRLGAQATAPQSEQEAKPNRRSFVSGNDRRDAEVVWRQQGKMM